MPIDHARVLIVDDDEDDALLARSLLDHSVRPRYEVAWAPTYAEGLARLEDTAFDACLVDYRLGAENGVAFVEEAIRRGGGVPFILLTGEVDRDVDLASMRAGASDFLQKRDLTAPVLDRAIRYAIQHRRLEDQRLEINLAQAARESAERANTAKDQFIALLAHELRNPMAGLSNAVTLLGSPGATPAALTFAREVLQRQTLIMRRLVDDLLDVARLSHGKLVLDCQPVDLCEVARRAAATARLACEQRSLTLTDLVPSEPLVLDGDAVRLEQAIGNLLDNAAKFTPDGGHVGLTVAREGDCASITVSDSGVGLTAEMRDQAFELFVQQRPVAGHAGGLGVGLGVVRGIVEGHHGQVTAESPGPGHGATFTIQLPLLDHRTPPRRLTVLVVDDNPDGAELLAQLLGLHGAEAIVAGDGAGALELFRRHAPDAVCLDVGLPDLDGFEVARRMREAADRPFTLAMLSGFTRPTDRARAIESGADEFFVKPPDVDALCRFLTARDR